MRGLLLFFGAIVLLSSCVTNKKVLYLQADDFKKEHIPIDTVLRRYSLKEWDHKLQPQDVLSVRFESLTPEEFDFMQQTGQGTQINPSLSLALGELVDLQGEINYPVIGKVKVGGLTVFEAQELLQKTAEDFLESPKVTVRLLNFRVTVLGEVNSEGTIGLANNRVSLLEAIGLAGGLGELADRSRVKLIRLNGDFTEVQYINLLDEEFLQSPNYYVHQNDILIVPPLRQRAFRRYFGPNLGLVISSLSLLLLTYNLIK